jgi:hypothetical protein
MKIGIAADHGGFELRKYLWEKLSGLGHEIVDFGNSTFDIHDDYPDYVIPLATAISEKKVDRGIALCGSGVGACIAANRIKDVRACLICDTFKTCLCLSGRSKYAVNDTLHQPEDDIGHDRADGGDQAPDQKDCPAEAPCRADCPFKERPCMFWFIVGFAAHCVSPVIGCRWWKCRFLADTHISNLYIINYTLAR